MEVSSPMLLGVYDPSRLAGSDEWYVSEKYDGWRMIYQQGYFYSRQKKQLLLPTTCPINTEIKQLGNVVLDGELGLGYNTFNQLAGVVSSEIPPDNLRYMIFDAPCVEGTYKQRYAYLRQLFQQFGPFKSLVLVEQHLYTSTEITQIDQLYQTIIERGGEGIVLRPKKMPYV